MATILVIDDEEMIRTLSEKILQRASYDVLTAETGAEAISIYKNNSSEIDLLIIDMQLDDMNGFEILEEIRKLDPEIPGIISSGNNYQLKDIPESIRNNISFLQKPYRSQTLTELVNSLVVLS